MRANSEAGFEHSASGALQLFGGVRTSSIYQEIFMKSIARAVLVGSFMVALAWGVIGTFFLDALLGTNLKWLVSVLVVAAMIAVIGGLVSFLAEVYLVTRTLRGPPGGSDGVGSPSNAAGSSGAQIMTARTLT